MRYAQHLQITSVSKEQLDQDLLCLLRLFLLSNKKRVEHIRFNSIGDAYIRRGNSQCDIYI
jgi:hypothetical protein